MQWLAMSIMDGCTAPRTAAIYTLRWGAVGTSLWELEHNNNNVNSTPISKQMMAKNTYTVNQSKILIYSFQQHLYAVCHSHYLCTVCIIRNNKICDKSKIESVAKDQKISVVRGQFWYMSIRRRSTFKPGSYFIFHIALFCFVFVNYEADKKSRGPPMWHLQIHIVI